METIVVPGNPICATEGHVCGHGTFVQKNHLIANVAGQVRQVNKLVSVKPISSRYIGTVGDVVIGRVLEVQSKRWMVDVRSADTAVLPLSSIHLSGGALRRRTSADELGMRNILSERDVVVADVHSIHSDGSLALHARSMAYGKCTNGVLVSVPPSAVPKLPSHFVHLPNGCHVLMGCNGWVWVTITFTPAMQAAAGLSTETIQAAQRQEPVAVEAVKSAAAAKVCALSAPLPSLAGQAQHCQVCQQARLATPHTDTVRAFTLAGACALPYRNSPCKSAMR